MDNFLIVMKALSDKTRLEIIELLLNYDFCVGALAIKLEISEASVSQHLKVLRNAGIISGEKRGYYTHYDIKHELLAETAEAIRALAEHLEPRKACKQHLSGDHSLCKNLKLPMNKY